MSSIRASTRFSNLDSRTPVVTRSSLMIHRPQGGVMHLSKSMIGTVALVGLVCGGCTMNWPWSSSDTGFAYQNFPVAKTSASAGDGHTVAFKGTPLALQGPGVKVGDTLPNVQVAKSDLSLVNIADTKGTVRVISIVPSLDTKVCEQQTHYLSEKNKG